MCQGCSLGVQPKKPWREDRRSQKQRNQTDRPHGTLKPPQSGSLTRQPDKLALNRQCHALMFPVAQLPCGSC